MGAREELLGLARELRLRAEDSDGSEWVASRGAVSEKKRAETATAPRAERLGRLAAEVATCRKCPLGETRLNPAFGVGSENSPVLFIGEGPGFAEDHKGEPFVGPAGQLLDKILASIGLSRQTVYIANVVKCHPMKNPSNPEARSNDRPPTEEEAAACKPYLEEQIRVISPRWIVTLGAVATRYLLGAQEPLSRVRGQWQTYKLDGLDRDIQVLPTYHPAALLRDPSRKKDVWEDMKKLRKEMEGASK